MINTIRSEFIKLRTIVSHWVLSIIAVLFPIIVTVLVTILGFDVGPSAGDLASLIVGVSVVSAMLLGTVAAVSLTSDYAHNTIRPTYAATPGRLRVIGAKVIVSAGSTLVLMLVTVGVSWLVGALILGARDRGVSLGDDGAAASLISTVALGTTVALFAIGLGLIIRNSPTTITLLLLWPLLIENLLALVLGLSGVDGVGKWMPYQAAITAAADGSSDFDDQLGRPWGLLYFAAVSAGLVVLGGLLDDRRDA